MKDACIHVMIHGGGVVGTHLHIDDLICDLNPDEYLVLHFQCDTVYTKEGFLDSHPSDSTELASPQSEKGE